VGDALYRSDDLWVSHLDEWFGSTSISLWVNEDRVAWGDYQPDHRYSVKLSPVASSDGKGAFTFKLNDCPGCTGDNRGSLRVRIFSTPYPKKADGACPL
jgi:hypothetical protein